MTNNTRQYYSLPTKTPPRSRSGSLRPPLTPSVVSSPCLTTFVQVPARRDSRSSTASPTKAEALLARVVSQPSSPRYDREHVESPLFSPKMRLQSSLEHSPEKLVLSRSESERHVKQYKQQDGYVSFPDFENFHQVQNAYDQHHEQTAVKT